MSNLYWNPLRGVSSYFGSWFSNSDASLVNNNNALSPKLTDEPMEAERHPERDSESDEFMDDNYDAKLEDRQSETFERAQYAVALVRDAPLQNDDAPPFLFDSMSGVLHFCRQYKASHPRWKRFQTRAEAEKFSLASFDYEPEDQLVNKEALPFKTPTPQQFVQLRKYIQDGEIDEVRELIDSNPRYIIGSGDNPTILQEGCRYNAFHVAAKSNQADIMKLILDRLRSPDYYRRLYPGDGDRSTRDRIAYIVDMYLNMPDKTRKGESPLHFAAKFGCVSGVKFLLEQEECDRTARNCECMLAVDVICERGGGQAEARNIEQMFQQNFVIPIFRNEEDDGVPQVTPPITFEELKKILSPSESPRKRLAGFVGPLTFQRASKMMKDIEDAWFTVENVDIRKRDAEKGLETIVRNVARVHSVPFREDWPFLGCALDIASETGLRALNTYLENRTFIHGVSPSKPDYNVWCALEPVSNEITTSDSLPHIQRWAYAMRRFANSEMKTWRTPKKERILRYEAQPESNAKLVNLMERFMLEET